MNPRKNESEPVTETEEKNYELVNDIEVIIPDYKKGEHNREAQVTEIRFFDKAEKLFKDKTADTQRGKPVYQLVFTVLGDIPEGLQNSGNSVISKTTGRSKNSKLYQYNERYGNYPKVGDMVKVENDTEGFWQLIL